jgi:hypothetical protein
VPPWDEAYFPGSESSSSWNDWKLRSILSEAAYPANKTRMASASSGNFAGVICIFMVRAEVKKGGESREET